MFRQWGVRYSVVIGSVLLGLATFAGPRAEAQQNLSRFEVYGAYSVLHPRLPASIGGSDTSAKKLGEFALSNLLGWNAGVTLRIVKSLAITADTSGYYKGISATAEGSNFTVKLRLYGLLVGPRYNFRAGERMQPFVHALFGAGLVDAMATVDTDSQKFKKTGYAAAIGGGLDLPVSRAVSIRAAQFDYFPIRETKTGSLMFNNFRWQTGIVFRFGK